MEELMDEQIWTTFKAGDDEALTYIYNTYIQKLYNYGRQFTPDAEVVRDVIQDLFCELIQNRQKLGNTNSIK